ncbi:crustacean hyperglycemic hormones 3-like [Centruroides sculpturatus]|uniref:crustacean hyperglycemic hormones 3-like n=1 Tax=Centruroides sculpturatus TaxID=218467 RepID=UPI000C6D4B9D|nr:crustacean hyperglycemic hormones 3-like [Centruroides sculpturatus]
MGGTPTYTRVDLYIKHQHLQQNIIIPEKLTEALDKTEMAHLLKRQVFLMILFVVFATIQSQIFSKRKFERLGCTGKYNKPMFARLSRHCQECYQLYKDIDVEIICRSNCFNNDYFNRCMDALMLKSDERDELKEMVKTLNGYDINFNVIF